MQISGVSPMHIARAYQVQQNGGVRPATPPTQVRQTQQLLPAQFQPSLSPPNEAQLSANVDAIVAARVSQPVTFNGTADRNISGPALAMYTRAADRIEAGTSLHIGRSVDLSG